MHKGVLFFPDKRCCAATRGVLSEVRRLGERNLLHTCEDPVLLARLAPADLERRVQDLGETQVTHGAGSCQE